MRLSLGTLLAIVVLACCDGQLHAEWWKPWRSSSTSSNSSASQPAARTASTTNSRTPTAPQQSQLTFAPGAGAPQASVTIPAATSPAGPTATRAAKRTWSSRFRDAASATRNAFTIKPREIPADDPVRLSSNQAPAQPEVFIAAAHVYENQGRLKEARQQYEKAIAADKQHVEALVGLARLQHREGDLTAATQLYQRALAAHPNNSVVLNDLGLCYARQGQLEQARQSLASAVAQDPRSKLYRNNLAVVLVEMNQPQAALAQLQEVHGEAVGHYNLGYMLRDKGETAAAAHHLQTALALEPRMEPARQMLAQMAPQAAPAWTPRLGQPQIDAPANVPPREQELPMQRDYPVNYRPAPQPENYPPANDRTGPQYQPAVVPQYAPPQGVPAVAPRAQMNFSDESATNFGQNPSPTASGYRPTINYTQPPLNQAPPAANYAFPPTGTAQRPGEAPLPVAPAPGAMPDYMRRVEQPPAEAAQPSRSSRWSP